MKFPEVNSQFTLPIMKCFVSDYGLSDTTKTQIEISYKLNLVQHIASDCMRIIVLYVCSDVLTGTINTRTSSYIRCGIGKINGFPSGNM